METQKNVASSRPLFMHFAPIESRTIETQSTGIYDPARQETVIDWRAGGGSTSCMQATSGTEPKNEADAVMDDN